MTAMRLRPDEHYGVVGATGSGKTTWLNKVLWPSMLRMPNTYYVILDYKDEWKQKDEKLVHDPQELSEALYKGKKPEAKIMRVVPVHAPSPELAEMYLRSAWAPTQTNNIQYKPNFGIRLLVDDMPVWYQETGGKGPQDWLNMWMSVGRAKRRGIIWISQRYAQIPKILPTQTTGFTVFFKTQPYDRKRIRIEFGNQVASAVASVKQYGYVMASDWLPNFYEVYNPLKGRFKARPKGVELKGLD